MVYVQLEKTDYEVLTFLISDINKEYSIRELSQHLKRPYVKVYNSIKRLQKQKIILITVKGKSHYCMINYKNNIDIVCFIEYQKTKGFLKSNKKIKLIVDEITRSVKTPNYSLVLFGSYAKGTADKHSDLDIAIITSSEDKEEAERAINTIKRLSSIEIHSIEFTFKNFIEMLISKENNVGKEIIKNPIIIKGAEQFHESINLSK